MPPRKTKRGYILETTNQDGTITKEWIKDTGFHPGQNVLVNGKAGRLYESQPFDAQGEIDALLKRMVGKKPTLAPYLKSMKLPQSYHDFMQADPASPEGIDAKERLNREFAAISTTFLPSNLVDSAMEGYKKVLHYPKIGECLGLSPQDQMTLAQMPEFDEIALEFCEDMNHILTRVSDNANSRIPDKADVSRYHEAMGDIAKLLGFPEMVAKSQRVPIKNNNGEVHFATFVEQPEGHNIADYKENNIFLDKDHNPLMDPDAMKMLSNMSVLDYITGSSMYNLTDLTFQTDPNNPAKITNIVRHSPGDCFGLLDPEKRFDHRSTAPYLRDIRVIPRKTAEALSNSEFQNNLRFVLAGKGFTPEQINVCCHRAAILQAALEAPSPKITDDDQIHIMDDADFQKVNPQELYVKMSVLESKEKLENDVHGAQYCKNIFARCADVRETAKLASNQHREEVTGEAFDHLYKFEKEQPLASNLDINLGTLSARFKEIDPPLLKSSKEFKDMKKAMGDLAKLIIRVDSSRNIRSLEDLKAIKEGFAEIQKQSAAYIEKKDNSRIKGTHGRERYEFAKMVQDYSAIMQKTLDAELKTRKAPNHVKAPNSVKAPAAPEVKQRKSLH